VRAQARAASWLFSVSSTATSLVVQHCSERFKGLEGFGNHRTVLTGSRRVRNVTE